MKPKKIDPKEVITGLKELQLVGDNDPETAHFIADKLLCEFLKDLGFESVVKAWEAVPKWYA